MSLEIVNQFDILLEEGKYEEAAEALADDVYFSSPKFTYKSRSEWLDKFPAFHQKNANGAGPKFAPPEAVSDKIYVRRGKAKIMGFQISVKETIELNDEGKIVKSVMQKA